MTIAIYHTNADDLNAIKVLCDAHRVELGFVMRPSLAAAIVAGELMIARDLNISKECIGLVHYHHRRDTQTTLYHLVVSVSARGQGIGRALVLAVRNEAHECGKTFIRLKCPEPLPANNFYSQVGFVKVATEPGKSRPLCIWEMTIV